MNPRLHHPVWYRLIDAISPEEEAAALASPNLVLVQPFARFELPGSGIGISCQENRWEITAQNPVQRERIRDITTIVFKKLYETPVEVYGFNIHLEMETPLSDVRKCIADLAVALEIGFAAEGQASCTMRFSDLQKARRLQIEIAPSHLSTDVLSVRFNAEYRTSEEVGQKVGYFDLGNLVAVHYDADYESAMESASRFVTSLVRRCGAN
jgi:hypothetical protein